MAVRLADEAKRLFDDNLPYQDIATLLSCDRNTVTAAIVHWHESRGLPVPDGRNRRKELREQRERGDGPVEGETGRQDFA